MPLSFISNHSPSTYEEGKYYESDQYIHFRATVTGLYHGVFDADDIKENTFIRCFASTQYGELQFDHTYEQVPEELRGNIKVGAVISGICILSGDVALGEYENGFVRDFDHDLKLMRYTFEKGEAERLREALAENAVYESETVERVYSGADEIIERLKYVHDNAAAEYYAYLAVITEADDLEYPVGTRCVVLAYSEEDNYESIVFLTVDDGGMITRIHVSRGEGYRFRVDVPFERNVIQDGPELPQNVTEPIIARARLHGIMPFDMDDEELMKGVTDPAYLRDNALRMLESLKKASPQEAEEAYGNILGYLFAKGMEYAYNREKGRDVQGTALLASYYPDEALEGRISSSLPEEKHERLVLAMDLGRQFYNDLEYMVKLKDITDEQEFIGIYTEAAVAVQRLGQLGAEEFLNRGGER